MSKLQNPLFAAVLGVVFSVVLGVATVWRVLVPAMEKAAAEAAAAPGGKKVTAAMKQRGWDFWTIEIDNLANELKEERARLKQQAELLDQRAARVAADERELAKVRSEIDAMRKEIADKIVEVSADETKNLRSLAQTYASLSPRAAVAIFREMDDSTAVKILALMKSDIVGPIFEQMSQAAGPDGTPLARRAALLSEKLRLVKAAKATASS